MKSLNLTGVPAPADKIITDLVSGIDHINPDFIEGMYLTGSIPENDFYPAKSDIDFLILCQFFPDAKMVSQLRQVHRAIQKQFKKPDLSGHYLTLDTLRHNDLQKVNVLSFHEERIGYATFGMAPVTLSELKTVAHTVFGIPAHHLPVNIETKDLHAFLYHNINSYWRKWIKQHSSFRIRQVLLFLFPRLTEWAVLGVARQLYTLQTGKIGSKTEAGYYCLEQVPARFHHIILEAIKIRKDTRRFFLTIKGSYHISPSLKRLHQTIDCVNFIIDLFNRIYEMRYQVSAIRYQV